MTTVTPELVAQMRSLRVQGLTSAEIALALGIGTATAKKYIRDLPRPTRRKGYKRKITAKVPKVPTPSQTLASIVVKLHGGIFDADIERLKTRARVLENGLLASTRVRARLIYEVIAGMERAQIRAAESGMNTLRPPLKPAPVPPPAAPPAPALPVRVVRLALGEHGGLVLAVGAENASEHHVFEIASVADLFAFRRLRVAIYTTTGLVLDSAFGFWRDSVVPQLLEDAAFGGEATFKLRTP